MENDFGRKWGWQHTIDALAKGKLWRYDDVTSTNVRVFLTKALYDHEKRQVENNKMENMKRKR